MKQKGLFTRRLNTDKEERTLEQGEYRAALHARIGTSSQGNVNAVEPIQSNAIRTEGLTFTGVNKCIGTCQDIKNNAIIYCIWNSNKQHRIIRYTPSTQTVEDLLPLTWNVEVLNWLYVEGVRTSQKRLWNLRIVETGDYQLMFFTNGYNQPRRINLQLKDVRGTGAYTLTEDDIAVAKKPPFEPAWTYAIDTVEPSNFIRNKWFQFRARYIYENGEISSWSAWSPLTIPPQDGVEYNLINVTVFSGDITVKKVEVARREGNGVSSTATTNTELYIFATIDNTTQSSIDVPFRNSEVLKPVSRTTSDINFYAVPQLAGCQEVVESNQVVYGDITEGYNNLIIEDADLPILEATYDQTTIKAFEIVFDISASAYFIYVPPTYVPLLNQKVTIKIGTNLIFSYTISTVSRGAFMAEIAATINGKNGFTATVVGDYIETSITTSISVYSYEVDFTSINEFGSYTKTVDQTIGGGYVKIIYENATINGMVRVNQSDFKITENVFGTITFDIGFSISTAIGGDYSMVLLDVTTNTPIVYIRSTVISGISSDTFNFKIDSNTIVGKTIAIAVENISTSALIIRINSSLQIDLQVPHYFKKGFKSGATHKFGIVYLDEYFRQTGVQAVSSIYIPSPAQRDYGLPYNFTDTTDNQDGYIPQINWAIQHRPPIMAKYYKWVYNESNISNFCQFIANVKDPSVSANVGYNFIIITTQSLSLYPFLFKDITEGDVIRIILTQGDGLLGLTGAPYIESTVLSVSPTELKIDTANGLINTQNINGALVEVFVTNQSEFFYETRNIYTIGNAGTDQAYHNGQTQNQTADLSQNAEGTFLGTTYFYINNEVLGSGTSPNTTAFTENSNIDNNFESNFWDKGRPQIETPNQKQQRIPWMLRWGGKLFQDTEINNMSAFDTGNYKILSAKYGGVIGLREIGYTMKIIQEVNYSTAYIGRREITNADGSSQLVLTDNLIGQINDSNFGFGTKYAGSIVVNDNKMYFFDTTKMQVIREAGNAPFAISSYGMARYFREASGIIQNGDYEIITGFNKQEQSMYMTWFSNVLTEQNITYGAANVSETDPLVIAIDLPVPTLVVGDKIRVYQNTTSFIAEIEIITFGFYRLILISGTPNLNAITAISLLYVESSQETISFLEPERDSVEPGWTTNHDMEKTIDSKIVPIDMYGFIGGIFTTVLNANIYEHNAVGNYLNLFGENKDFKITSVFNLEPDASKVFLAHAVHSNITMDKTTLVIPANQNYPVGMKSILVEGNYKLREGAFYADIKKDGYSKGFAAENTVQFINGLINGRPMRGRVIEVEILYQGNDIFVLFSHEVEIQYSPLS
jgi:hypothetical protein